MGRAGVPYTDSTRSIWFEVPFTPETLHGARRALILGDVSIELSPSLMQMDLRSKMSCTITLKSLTLNLQIIPSITQALIFPLIAFRTSFQWRFIIPKYWLRREPWPNIGKQNNNIHSYKSSSRIQTIRKKATWWCILSVLSKDFWTIFHFHGLRHFQDKNLLFHDWST